MSKCKAGCLNGAVRDGYCYPHWYATTSIKHSGLNERSSSIRPLPAEGKKPTARNLLVFKEEICGKNSNNGLSDKTDSSEQL